MPKSITPKKSYRKYRNQSLLYDMDLDYRQRLIRIQITTEQDSTGIPTPVTPLYQARFTGDNPFSIPARDFDPRNILCCFNNFGVRVERTVYIPYSPTNNNLKLHIREVVNYPGVETLDYTGETHSRNVEIYYQVT